MHLETSEGERIALMSVFGVNSLTEFDAANATVENHLVGKVEQCVSQFDYGNLEASLASKFALMSTFGIYSRVGILRMCAPCGALSDTLSLFDSASVATLWASVPVGRALGIMEWSPPPFTCSCQCQICSSVSC